MGLKEVLLDQPAPPPGTAERAFNSPLVQTVWLLGSLAAVALAGLWLVVVAGSPSGFERSAWQYASAAACPVPLLSWLFWRLSR